MNQSYKMQPTSLAHFSTQSKDKKRTKPEYLFGINPVYAALRAQRRKPQKLYLNIAEKDQSKVPNSRIQKITDLAKKEKIQMKYMHRVKLAKFCGGRQHQNVILKTEKIEYTDIRNINDIIDNDGGDKTSGPVEGKFFLFLD